MRGMGWWLALAVGCGPGTTTAGTCGTEVCDGIDNNCDGVIDEPEAADTRIWYADLDEDGFGDVDNPAAGCTAPAGYVEDATDCDDTEPSVFPEADEQCDGLDNDCNGRADDDAIDRATVVPDLDEDGFGDATATPYVGCDPPKDYISDRSDCDDADPDVNPEGSEICDGIDNDCDVATSEDDTATWIAADGTVTDWTAVLRGTKKGPIDVTLDAPGTLSVCGGVWSTRLLVTESVDVVGHSAPVLDAGGSGSVVTVDAPGATVSFEAITLQRGGGSQCDPGAFAAARGGGLCVRDVDQLTGTRLRITGNQADFGGGVFQMAGVTTFDGVALEGNQAVAQAGGAFVQGGSLTITDSTVSSNEAGTFGGALVAVTEEAEIVMNDTLARFNQAGSLGGGAMIERGARLECNGSKAVVAGFHSNSAINGSGAVHIWPSGGTFEAAGCDLGVAGTKDDNTPNDISSDSATEYDDDVSVVCTLDGCT